MLPVPRNKTELAYLLAQYGFINKSGYGNNGKVHAMSLPLTYKLSLVFTITDDLAVVEGTAYYNHNHYSGKDGIFPVIEYGKPFDLYKYIQSYYMSFRLYNGSLHSDKISSRSIEEVNSWLRAYTTGYSFASFCLAVRGNIECDYSFMLATNLLNSNEKSDDYVYTINFSFNSNTNSVSFIFYFPGDKEDVTQHIPFDIFLKLETVEDFMDYYTSEPVIRHYFRNKNIDFLLNTLD